jgi:hypothetical protein
VKFAVSVIAPLMVTVREVELGPLVALPLKPVNWYPLAGVAVIVTELPLLYQPLAGKMLPPPEGLTCVVRYAGTVRLASSPTGLESHWLSSTVLSNWYVCPAMPGRKATAMVNTTELFEEFTAETNVAVQEFGSETVT